MKNPFGPWMPTPTPRVKATVTVTKNPPPKVDLLDLDPTKVTEHGRGTRYEPFQDQPTATHRRQAPPTAAAWAVAFFIFAAPIAIMAAVWRMERDLARERCVELHVDMIARAIARREPPRRTTDVNRDGDVDAKDIDAAERDRCIIR